MYLLLLLTLIQSRVEGAAVSRDAQTSLAPQASWETSSLQRVLGLPRGPPSLWDKSGTPLLGGEADAQAT